MTQRLYIRDHSRFTADMEVLQDVFLLSLWERTYLVKWILSYWQIEGIKSIYRGYLEFLRFLLCGRGVVGQNLEYKKKREPLGSFGETGSANGAFAELDYPHTVDQGC